MCKWFNLTKYSFFKRCQEPNENLLQCSGCKLAKYCSKGCQMKHWSESHKHLCKNSQANILLKLACLPRYKTFEKRFTFEEMPGYIYDQEMAERPSFYESKKGLSKPLQKPLAIDRCGLCGLNNRECYQNKGCSLIQTDCCNNWICDDEHTYKIGNNK